MLPFLVAKIMRLTKGPDLGTQRIGPIHSPSSLQTNLAVTRVPPSFLSLIFFLQPNWMLVYHPFYSLRHSEALGAVDPDFRKPGEQPFLFAHEKESLKCSLHSHTISPDER